MVCLIVECALVAQFVGTTNTAALKAAVAMSVFLDLLMTRAAADYLQVLHLCRVL